jgi:hypothetical protein
MPANDQVQDAGLIFVLGGGYALHYRNLLLSMLLEMPMTTSASPVDYGPAASFTLGVAIDLGAPHPPR